MKKNIIIMIILVLSAHLYSQVTIGSGDPPHESAVLEIKVPSGNKGFLGPRVELTRRDTSSPIENPASGLLVLSTTDSPDGVPEEFKVKAGKFYYWLATEWIEIADQKRLDILINEELDKLGIPRIAFFNLDGKDVISGSGSNIRYGINDFMKDIVIGGSKDVPLTQIANHTDEAISFSTRVVSGVTQYLITFKPGIYNILFSYEFLPMAGATSTTPDCNNSSYFMDFPLSNGITGDRARIHSNSYHNKGNRSNHASSISYVVKIDAQTVWRVRLGTGQAGDCVIEKNGNLYGIGGFAISNTGTFLSILKVGDNK